MAKPPSSGERRRGRVKQSTPDIFQTAGQEVERRQPEKRFNLAKAMGEIVGVFCDPIIVMPGGWGDSLPEWIKGAITLERLIENIESFKRGAMTATDAEACAYLFTASLTAPISHDWSQIYLYVTTKVYERYRAKDSGVTMPEDIRVTELTRDQQYDLAQLKGWIYDRRERQRKERARDQRKESKAGEEAAAPPEDLQTGFDLWKTD